MRVMARSALWKALSADELWPPASGEGQPNGAF